MDDIARECGVSKMTVSRVLAGRRGVSGAMREKVFSVAKELNYESNILASNFAQRRSGFVGVATPFEGLLQTNFLAMVFRGCQQVLRDSQWDFALFDLLSPSFSDGSKLEKLYRSRKVDGLLVVAPHLDDQFLSTLTHLKILLVVVGEMVTSSDVSCVACDDYQGIELACDHLYSLGHRRIAFVGGPQDLASARRRENAYVEFCRRRNLRLPGTFTQVGDYTMHSGHAAGSELLASKDRPTAIIAANDTMAFGLIECARKLKIEVPSDVSIVGFDDLPMAAEIFPPLTTVCQPVAEMAARAAQLLMNAFDTGQRPEERIVLPVHLVQRASTAPPPSETIS